MQQGLNEGYGNELGAQGGHLSQPFPREENANAGICGWEENVASRGRQEHLGQALPCPAQLRDS